MGVWNNKEKSLKMYLKSPWKVLEKGMSWSVGTMLGQEKLHFSDYQQFPALVTGYVIVVTLSSDKRFCFYAPGLKDQPGASSSQIVCPSDYRSIYLSICQ